MKLLFTSVGRRVELVQAFQKAAAEKEGFELTIYGADLSQTAPAVFFCDEYVKTPRIADSSYIDYLIEVCKENKIDALIPTIDTDLLALAKAKGDFLKVGTKVIVSDSDKVAICRDKRKTCEFLKGIGLKSPETFDDVSKYDLGFPAFIKPKDGSSSINTFEVKNKEELGDIAKRIPDYIIQPFIKGVEYSIDIFCDFESEPVFITPRIRLAMRSGEVLKTETRQDEKIIDEAKKIIAAFKPVGAINVQLIRDEKTGDDYFIEINPRFGGGSPLSIKAGADSPKALLDLLEGKKVSYKEKAAEDGAIYSRFDQSVRVK